MQEQFDSFFNNQYFYWHRQWDSNLHGLDISDFAIVTQDKAVHKAYKLIKNELIKEHQIFFQHPFFRYVLSKNNKFSTLLM